MDMSTSSTPGLPTAEEASNPAQIAFLASQNPIFHISDSLEIRNNHHVFATEQSRPPSISSLSLDADSPSEQPLETDGFRGNPSWVARPRNEFILFRCEFVRIHSGESRRLPRLPGQDTDKSLSKQAAEAWHRLSPQDRLYWKEKANNERSEHARRYPEYKYRPRKNIGHRRSARSLSIQPPSLHLTASQAGSSAYGHGHHQSGSQSSVSYAIEDSRTAASPRMGRRRALSVPSSVASGALRLASVDMSERSPPSSAPPTKLCFDQNIDQFPIYQSSMPSRYQSTPILPVYDNRGEHRISPQPTFVVPLHANNSDTLHMRPREPQLVIQISRTPSNSSVSLSPLNLADTPAQNADFSRYTTGGEPFDLPTYGYHSSEGSAWPQPYNPTTSPFASASIPLSRSGSSNFDAFGQISDTSTLNAQPNTQIPFLQHDIAESTPSTSHQPAFAPQNTDFFSEEF